MKIFVAIDDTDNEDSKGTGFRARQLSAMIHEAGLGNISGVTRHQLFVNEAIPYTSHNSSACIVLMAEPGNIKKLIELSAKYLLEHAAEGSDAGLCVCTETDITDELIAYGKRAKCEVLTMDMARQLAKKLNVFLEGYTGTKQGIIGSLAAVGLNAGGNDGRFLLAKGMREIFGSHTAKEILEITGVEKIKTTENQILFNFEKILLTEWWRPVLLQNQAVLLVEPVKDKDYEYIVISKDRIKSISN
ncbi:MAG TPA: hypothetical protein PLS26_13885 [Bacteroidales bacterium]|nr:hypothetical protein [Bacteroidales bacterium]